MRLFTLNDGRVSLEFESDEWRFVQSGLSKTAGRKRYKVREEATHDMIEICGEELVVMNEWEEPCLISLTEQGDALIKRVYSRAADALVNSSPRRAKSGTALAA